jgi:hypothetical protein
LQLIVPTINCLKIKNFQEKFLKRDLAGVEDYYAGLWTELEEKEKRQPAVTA